jgi:hypothetical protein
VLFLATVFIAGCSDDDDDDFTPVETSGFYICNEGLMNELNSSSIAFYSFDENRLYSNYFSSVNDEPVGDTPNDMAVYGSKMYCVVTGSGIIHVFNAQSGELLQQIDMKTESDASKNPRRIAFYKNKAYVTSFDNTVCRIDTTTLLVEQALEIGNNPDGICVANGKIYISNSGAYQLTFGNTVSVIDVATFKKFKDIPVTVNPGKMMSDKYGDVYLLSVGDYGDVKSCFQRIDSRTDELVYTSDFRASNFTIYDNTAYIYSYEYDNNWNVVNQKLMSYDVRTENIIADNFITDNTELNIPYGISVNPQDQNLYIANVADYTGKADIMQFGTDGKLKKTILNVGINPNSIVFVEK